MYFVHPSTNTSVDISTNTRPMYRSTYRPSVDRYVGRHIDRLSADITTKICWSTYRPTICRYLGQYSGQHSANTYADHCLSAEYRSTVGGISVKSLDCQCQMYKLYADKSFPHDQTSHFPMILFWSTSKISKASRSDHVPQIQSLSSNTLKLNYVCKLQSPIRK